MFAAFYNHSANITNYIHSLFQEVTLTSLFCNLDARHNGVHSTRVSIGSLCFSLKVYASIRGPDLDIVGRKLSQVRVTLAPGSRSSRTPTIRRPSSL